MPAILVLPSSFVSQVAASSITEPQAHSSFGQDVIVVETAPMLCVGVSRCCIARRGPHAPALLGTESSSQSTPIAHWYGLLWTIATLAIVLLVLVVLGRVIRDLRRVHHTGFNQGGAVPEAESSSLFGTRVSSSTTLYADYRSCRSVATTAVHTPNRSPRGSTKPTLQPVHATHSDSILGEYGDYVTSPVENTPFLWEPLTMGVAQPLDSAVRGRASAVTQKTESISSNHFDQRTDESQAHKLDAHRSTEVSRNRTQTQHVSSSITPLVLANEVRAQTAPCVKGRSASLAKSLVGLVSIQQAMVHVLAVGTSWEDIGDRSRALPGPLHDIEWLRNVFALQKNFRFASLLDHAATLATIRRSLEDMLSVAGENDILVLYFSGHGGQDDSFELYDSTSLTEVMLNDWIVQFRSTALRNNSVYIIFDFCRPDQVKPNTELANGVNVIWACSPTESALDLRLKDPNNHLPRSCFLLSLILAIDDVSEDPKAPVVQRFTTRMKELVQLIRGLHCFKAKFSHEMIQKNSNLPAVVKYIADHFPLHIKRAADRVSKDHWVLYFNPSHISANRRPLNPRNHRLGKNVGIEANMARNMTIPANLVRF